MNLYLSKANYQNIRKQFDEINKIYRFNFSHFKIAKHNYGREIRGAELFEKSFITGKLPNESEFYNIVYESLTDTDKKTIKARYESISDDSSSSCMEIVAAKTFMLWTGFLREVYLACELIRMDPDKGEIYKDVDADIGIGGHDLIYRRLSDNKETTIAVRHSGKTTDRYMHKKLKKGDPDIVIEIGRSGDLSLDLPTKEQIENLFKQIHE